MSNHDALSLLILILVLAVAIPVAFKMGIEIGIERQKQRAPELGLRGEILFRDPRGPLVSYSVVSLTHSLSSPSELVLMPTAALELRRAREGRDA